MHTKKFVVTTDSKHSYPVVENKLNRDFSAEQAGKKWVSDITYPRTGAGWFYLTVILDLYDRKVIGWSQSSDMTVENTIMTAWKMAVGNRPPSKHLIFHSDSRIQYACGDFVKLLGSYPNIERSMSQEIAGTTLWPRASLKRSKSNLFIGTNTNRNKMQHYPYSNG